MHAKTKNRLLLMWGIILIAIGVSTPFVRALARSDNRGDAPVIWIAGGLFLFGIVLTIQILFPSQRRDRFKHRLWGRNIS